ncbi:MAG: TIGR01212 family radical SAM protein [Oscillospiraceae bacterium]|nr:TIGR01212 family radical SAM protein [Oscillospiraceae bacterium]
MEERYYSLNRYLRETFGGKVYKLALSAGMTCPNRDGTLGTGGCVFCSAGGSGDFAESPCQSLRQQLDRAKERIRQKTDARMFIAYFQSYTNTYAPVKKLEKIFTEAIAEPDVVALSIATRPDCLGPEVVELLSRLNRIKPVWVELGLQTIHERTARYIRRGYPLEVYDDAVRRLKAAGITVITHVILGLPGETKEDMLATVAHLSGENRPDGIKLQLLHVLRGTDLAKDYEKGLFDTLSMEEYLDILFACLERLHPDIVVHRLTGDGAKRDLIAPLWTGDKKRVMNTLRRELETRNIRQGKNCPLGQNDHFLSGD